jgi:hypothetical protein
MWQTTVAMMRATMIHHDPIPATSFSRTRPIHVIPKTNFPRVKNVDIKGLLLKFEIELTA